MHSRVHIQIHNGQFKIMGMGAWHSYWYDPSHLLLTIPWIGFFLPICGAYVAITAVCDRLGTSN
ncbi:MAG: hypothetical protein AN486_08195 [Anabaena sp. AL93]|nr:MAG: hypothetical protein AN486_08195 [Anabaena sp. AL93]